MPARIARFLLLIALLAGPAAAQSLTVSNGATLRVDRGSVLDLGDATTLVEAGGGRVTGGTGLVMARRTLTAPAGVDVGGLGAEITSAADMGPTTVVRGHTVQAGAGGESIARFYDITPATNTGLAATLVFHYDEAETNGLTESELVLFRSDDGGATWEGAGGRVDVVANTVMLDGIDGFSRWTLGTAGAALAAALWLEDPFGGTDVDTVLSSAGATLAAALWLEGPFNGTDMDTHLSSVIPETDPYFGTATVPAGFFTGSPGEGVVDWVWIQLRTGDPDATMTVAAETAALLMRDGSVKATDATSDLLFDGVAPGSYYVVLGHRNHLAVMSAALVDCSSGACSYDFRAARAQAHGTTPMAALTGSGPFGLFAGDGNASGGVAASDQAVWLTDNGTAGYLDGDYNLSGGVTASDQAVWLTNKGTSAQLPPTASTPAQNPGVPAATSPRQPDRRPHYKEH